MAIYHVGYTISQHPRCPTEFIQHVNQIRNEFRNAMKGYGAIYTDETLFYLLYDGKLFELMSVLKDIFDTLLDGHTSRFRRTILPELYTCDFQMDICEVNPRQFPLKMADGDVQEVPILPAQV